MKDACPAETLDARRPRGDASSRPGGEQAPGGLRVGDELVESWLKEPPRAAAAAMLGIVSRPAIAIVVGI